MKILVLGNGGREHAIVKALQKDSAVEEIVCAPGNAGIAEDIKVVSVDASNPEAVLELAQKLDTNLVVIGPEAPLVAGVADVLREHDIAVFGPDKAAAAIEGSKAFAKDVMESAGILTAKSYTCTTVDEAELALDAFGDPFVVKDDGLAGGKGVVVTEDRKEAMDHAKACLKAGNNVVIEEYLDGPEVSLFVLSDGKKAVPLQPAQDFKRLREGDEGPNTGGMGAYTPLDWLPESFTQEVIDKVAQPCIDEMAKQGTPFVGLLYCGLAITREGIEVVEFNARFGDPETQVVLSVLETPLGQLMYDAATGNLADSEPIKFSNDYAVDVVLASGDYPSKPKIGYTITGLDQVDNSNVIHAGTTLTDEGDLINSGGRVLATVGKGETLDEARENAYAALQNIELEDSFYRKDIAQKAASGEIHL